MVLLKPEPERRIGWRGRYVDPDSGLTVKETLDRALTTAELRTDWAVRKSKELARRRLELEGGAVRETGTAFEDAVKRYYEHHPQLRPTTVDAYRAATDKLVGWAKRTRLDSADDLTRPRLMAFRAELVREKRHVMKPGEKRGVRRASEQLRSPWTINRELRAVRTCLQYLCDAGLLPRVNSDDLRVGLKKLDLPEDLIEYRKPSELQKFIEATLRHDADKFDATRDEHAGNGKPGSTPKHKPIAPFMTTLLLSGMRRGEALALTWDRVDLDGDGEIKIPRESKTKKAREVGLDVSPACKHLLAEMWMKAGRPKEGSVFGLTKGEAVAAERRLVADYGAPDGCNPQVLRSTCATYLTNAPGIFGAASAYRSAKRTGHSVQVAEKHYVRPVKIPPDAKTLEAAMQIEAQVQRVIDAIGTQSPRRVRAGA